MPDEISAADDLLVAANILENVRLDELVLRLMERSRPALGPNSSLAQLHGPTLGELLLFAARAVNIHNPHLLISGATVEDELQLSPGNAVPLGSLGDSLGLLLLILMYQIIQPLAQGRLKEIVLETTLPRSALRDSVWSEFRCQVVTDGNIHRISMPEELAALRNPEFDPASWNLAQKKLTEAERSRESSAVVWRIRARVANLLSAHGQVPRLKQVASEEGLSDRTVIRLLSNDSTSFHAIVEEERRHIAARLIIDSKITLEVVAETLGFTDRSSFGRSFRKWFGMPPGAYRRALASQTQKE